MNLENCNLHKAITVEPTTLVIDVARKMKESKERNIFVTENGVPVGVISSRDIVVRLVTNGLNPSEIVAEKIMNSPVFYKSSDTSIGEAYLYMMNESIFLLPVCKDNKLIGAVTMQELFKQIAENKK